MQLEVLLGSGHVEITGKMGMAVLAGEPTGCYILVT